MNKPRLVAWLNRFSVGLAVLVVCGSTLYVISEQPWFETSSLVAMIGDFPPLGVIRSRLSHHR